MIEESQNIATTVTADLSFYKNLLRKGVNLNIDKTK